MIEVDLEKRIFQVYGASMAGQVIFRKNLTLDQFRAFMAHRAACLIVF